MFKNEMMKGTMSDLDKKDEPRGPLREGLALISIPETSSPSDPTGPRLIPAVAQYPKSQISLSPLF